MQTSFIPFMTPPYPEAASTLKLLFIIPMNVFNTFTHFN